VRKDRAIEGDGDGGSYVRRRRASGRVRDANGRCLHPRLRRAHPPRAAGAADGGAAGGMMVATQPSLRTARRYAGKSRAGSGSELYVGYRLSTGLTEGWESLVRVVRAASGG